MRRLIVPVIALVVVLGGYVAYSAWSMREPPLPPLLAGIEWGTRQNDDPATDQQTAADDTAFRTAVTKAFAVGSPTEALTRRLTEEGFAVTPGHAVFERSDLICRTKWQVTWTDTGGALDAVDGSYGRVCL
jgi:hypothetical protein